MKITNTFYNPAQTGSARPNQGQKQGSGFEDILSQTAPSTSSAMKVPDEFRETESHDGLSATDSGQSANDKLLAEFAKWAKMSPTERIRAQYLEAHGLTETTLSQLDPDIQKAIEDDIKQTIKQQLDKQTQQDGGSTLLSPSL